MKLVDEVGPHDPDQTGCAGGPEVVASAMSKANFKVDEGKLKAALLEHYKKGAIPMFVVNEGRVFPGATSKNATPVAQAS